MKIILSNHAKDRLNEKRQKGITIYDVLNAAQSMPGKINSKGFRIRNCIARSGKRFELPVSDYDGKRLVITVVGLR